MKPTEMNIDHIHRLIDRYFEATATEAEERELRRLLASTRLKSPIIDEARAVMSYYSAGKRRRRLRLPNAAAAAVAAIICGASALFIMGRTGYANTDRCIAYVGRTEITDSRRVLDMMRSDLAEISQVSQTVESDLASELSTILQHTEP